MFFRVPVPLLEYLCINDVCIWIDTYDRFINSYGNWQSERKEEIVLPSTLKKLTAFMKGRRFKSIVLPENPEVLGGQRYNGVGGFMGAESLESVKFIGNKLKKIGMSCFAQTKSLKECS